MSLVGTWFDSKLDFAPPTILLGLLLCPWIWGIFFGGIQHSPVDGCSVASCNFGVLVGEDEHMSFYSTILKLEQHSVVDVTGNGSKVQCCKEQYCIGTWNVRSTNQGKLQVVKQEMARKHRHFRHQ